MENSFQYYTTLEKGKKHEELNPLLQAMYREFADLSKKKPDGVLNKNKIQMVNRLLKEILELLEDEPNIRFLDLLDEEEIPQYSDVVLILSQYSAAMKQFRDMHYGYDDDRGERSWFYKDKPVKKK